MIKTVKRSSNSKTGPIAVTYRAGSTATLGTCPASCPLNPQSSVGAKDIDVEYLDALRRAVPPQGLAWTYSHFPAAQLPLPVAGETVINASTDSVPAALSAVQSGRPATLTVPRAQAGAFPARIDGVRFIRCPAELHEQVTCQSCGGGAPLCARSAATSPRRDYVVVFAAHGAQARLVGSGRGGCYGSSGPVALQWSATRKSGAPDDAQALQAFARSLPVGSLLRHHVVGDIGRERA